MMDHLEFYFEIPLLSLSLAMVGCCLEGASVSLQLELDGPSCR